MSPVTGAPPAIGRPDPISAKWKPFELANTVLFMALVGTLSLEWISLGGFGGNDLKYFHLVAGAFVGVHLLRFRPRDRVFRILHHYRWFYGPWAFWICASALLGLLHEPYTALSELGREALYGSISVFVAAYFLDADHLRVKRLLQWTTLSTVLLLGTVLGVTFSSKGVNPLLLVRTAIAKADPSIISYQLLRVGFRSQNLTEVGANLRHKVFAPVLIAMAISLIFRQAGRRRGKWGDRLVLVSVAAGALVVVGSLSRSLTLCLAAAVGLFGLRMLVQARARPAQIAVMFTVVTVVAAAAISPVGGLLWQRYAGDTGSYAGRVDALSSAFASPSVDSVILGTNASRVEKSPHNLIARGWLSAGLFGIIPVLIYVLNFLRVWLRDVLGMVSGRSRWLLDVNHLWVSTLGILPAVRIFTGGAGLHLNEWVCIGILFGLLKANSLRKAALL